MSKPEYITNQIAETLKVQGETNKKLAKLYYNHSATIVESYLEFIQDGHDYKIVLSIIRELKNRP